MYTNIYRPNNIYAPDITKTMLYVAHIVNRGDSLYTVLVYTKQLQCSKHNLWKVMYPDKNFQHFFVNFGPGPKFTL